jgi:urease accessory protein
MLQLADSFFPSGMYTQSHGLESFVSAGVSGEEQLAPLLQVYLLQLAAPGDALAARWVTRAAAAGDVDLIAAIDARLEATKFAPEGRAASRRCGGRVLALGAELCEYELLRRYNRRVQEGCAPGHQAVALALLGVAMGLDEAAVAAVELHTFATSLVSAAVRLGALDHIGAQRLLLQARPWLMEAATIGETLDWQEIGGFALEIELMQFRHAYDEMHMFVS